MSKRDDDPQTDMEVGMTTAERRRRRRRGGGLRVPSDNVPRRASTPPVVPPVPEDPSLAMSIAYSFASESSEALPKATRESAPSFENHEGMPTVIDPVSGPVEQADFEMKTREMTAVDLEALGLSEAGTSNPAIPVQRLSNPGMETVHATSPGLAVRFTKRDATEPADDVDVDIDSTIDAEAGATGVDGSGPAADLDGALDRRITFERVSTDDDELAGEELSSDDLASEELSSDDLASEELPSEELSSDELTSDELSADEVPDDDVREDVEGEEVSGEEVSADEVPDDAELAELPTMQLPAVSLSGIPEPVHPVNETSQPRTVITEGSPPRLPISDASQPRVPLADLGRSPVTDAPPRPQMTAGAMPPLSPAFKARAQTVALSEDDLEEVREAARLATAPSGRPASTSIPPPMPPAKPVEARPRTTEPSSVPEIDILALEDKAAEASGEFEVDVEGIVDSRSSPVPAASAPASPAVAGEPRNKQPSQPPPLAHGHPTSNPPPLAHPVAASQPLPVAHHAPSQPLPAAPPPSQPPPAHGHAPAPAQSQALPLPHGPPPSPPPIGAPQARESQPMPIARDLPHASPPPPPVAHKAPPSPPPAKKDKPQVQSPATAASGARPDGKPPRGKPWFIDLFDEDYLRTLPFLTPQATQAEAEFAIDALGLTTGAQVLDVGCGYGRHAMELAARGFHVVGLDLSTPLLVRGGEEAHRRGLTINFVRGDMRELDFEAQFDGAYCLFSTFGYFDDETNKKTIANIARALKPGGRVLIEILNRDYVIADLPTRVWWEGDGCVVLEEVELNYFSSRIQVNRSVVFDDGRQLEQEISVRAYSLHEVGKLLHSAGFRVLEVSGAYHTRGRFFGNQSRHIIVLAERKEPTPP